MREWCSTCSRSFGVPRPARSSLYFDPTALGFDAMKSSCSARALAPDDSAAAAPVQSTVAEPLGELAVVVFGDVCKRVVGIVSSFSRVVVGSGESGAKRGQRSVRRRIRRQRRDPSSHGCQSLHDACCTGCKRRLKHGLLLFGQRAPREARCVVADGDAGCDDRRHPDCKGAHADRVGTPRQWGTCERMGSISLAVVHDHLGGIAGEGLLDLKCISQLCVAQVGKRMGSISPTQVGERMGSIFPNGNTCYDLLSSRLL